MRCKLSEAKNLNARPRFLKALPPNEISAIFLTLVLFAFAASVNAQEPSALGRAGTISGTAYLPGNNQPRSGVKDPAEAHRPRCAQFAKKE